MLPLGNLGFRILPSPISGHLRRCPSLRAAASARTRRRLADSPCPCLSSTMLSSRPTNRPSSWQSLHRSHRARKRSHIHHPDWGSPFHGLCSTTPSWQQTIPPANLRTHPGNCRDQPGEVALSVDRKCGGGHSTRSAWLSPRKSTLPLHNCMDQQVRVLLWAAPAALSQLA